MLIAFCAILVSNGISVADAQATQLEITGFTMGKIKYTILVAHHPDSVSPEELQDEVESTVERVNQLMSTYIPASDVSRFNSSDSTDFISVNSETANVVARAIQISERTGGAFDITVGPAVNLWNFGPDKSAPNSLPSNDQIDQVTKIIGYEKLEARTEPPAIRKSEPKLKIDLSAIAKGYAVDQVAKALDKAGCKQFMVEVGGEVYVRGERAAGGPWQIGVEQPDTTKSANSPMPGAKRGVYRVASITDRALATSGDYRNYFEFEGKRFSHTIDPKTCRPVEHELTSACIIAKDCMTADALATAVMVLGPEAGQVVSQREGVEFLFVTRDSDFGSKLSEVQSDGFPVFEPESLEKPAPKPSAAQGILPTFIGATVIIGLAILGMAIGSIFANKPVQGSCGGLSNATGDDCSICAQPTTDCVDNAEA